MAQQYLLPCECGKANPVSVAQAGRTMPCSCGREYVVPSLAGLRHLEPAVSGGNPKKSQAAGWSQWRGGLFVAGVLLALVGMPLGGYCSYIVSRIDVERIKEVSDSYESYDLKEIDRQSPLEVYETWQHIRTLGPGEADSSLLLRATRVRDFWYRLAVAAFASSGVGIAMAAGSLIGARGRQS
jgi:hypothetical protein